MVMDIDTLKQEITSFFDDYCQRYNSVLEGESPDVDGFAKLFTRCFIEANPCGITGGKNDKDFREAIPQSFHFYKRIGIINMEILSIKSEVLNEYHTMVKAHWRYSFVKVDSTLGEFEFDVIYLLHKEATDYKIFAYITGGEQKALKENELI